MRTIDGTPYEPTTRDRVALWLANAALKSATPEVRGFLGRAVDRALIHRWKR